MTAVLLRAFFAEHVRGERSSKHHKKARSKCIDNYLPRRSISLVVSGIFLSVRKINAQHNNNAFTVYLTLHPVSFQQMYAKKKIISASPHSLPSPSTFGENEQGGSKRTTIFCRPFVSISRVLRYFVPYFFSCCSERLAKES